MQPKNLASNLVSFIYELLLLNTNTFTLLVFLFMGGNPLYNLLFKHKKSKTYALNINNGSLYSTYICGSFCTTCLDINGFYNIE